MRKLVVISIALVLVFSCKKETYTNPYDEIVVVENENPNLDNIPVGNFAWLHHRIFGPTCANSGCHDGTFEPNFTTIASSYNSLVNHPVIANDASNSYTYRVEPGNSASSLLYARLTINIPNTSGTMPLATEPDSDWPQNSSGYIAQIQGWINNGAPDMFGTPAPAAGADFPPQVGGFAAFPSGNTTTPYEREGDTQEITPILVDPAVVDLWFLVTDDNTNPADMNGNLVKVSPSAANFETADEYPVTIESGINALDFTDTPANFIHKSSVDLTGSQSGDVFYVRGYWNDGVQAELTEIPSDGSNAFIQAIFVLKVI